MTVEDRLKKVRDKLNNSHNNNNDKDLVVDVPAGVSERIPNVGEKVVSDNGAKNNSSYLNVVKEKLGTRLNSGKGCPANILLYIASGRQCNDSVDPWYGQIKQLTDGASRYHSYIHMALVCTLYPEMEKAVEMFGEKIEQYAGKEPIGEKEFKRIEDEVIKKCGLKQSYNFSNITLTDEQKEHVDSLAEKFSLAKVRKKTKNATEVIQVISEALVKSGEPPFLVAEGMNNLDQALRSTYDDNVEVPNLSDVNFRKKFVKLSEMQEQGILGEKFEVLDFEKFKSSDLVKKFPLYSRTYDLSDKVSKPESANIKSREMGD